MRVLCSYPRLIIAIAALAAWFASVRPAAAHENGIAARGCEGCHGGTLGASVHLTATPSVFGPGQTVQLALTISGSGVQVGGAYITTGDVGKLLALANQGMAPVNGGLVHDRPKAVSNGAVTFNFGWQAPSAAGNVRFEVFALGANGDGRTSGDKATEGAFDFVFGCAGKTYFMDADGDGYGQDSATKLACDGVLPPGYVTRGGDCDDYSKTTYPGAPELCNQVDDNCDEQVDENAVPVELWPDADGDGYYDERTEKVGTPKLGCAGLKGFAAVPGDCNPHDPAIHPGADEVCNMVDDNCDGEVDERVRPTCGEGWCRRASPSCDPANCEEGKPVAERCNLLDDDCNGLTDEGPNLCPSGQTCAAGLCVENSDTEANAGGTANGTAGNRSPQTQPACGLSGAPRNLGLPCIFGILVYCFVARRRR